MAQKKKGKKQGGNKARGGRKEATQKGRETRTIRQGAMIRATPREVYEALMDAAKHSALVGAGARISTDVGGELDIWEGYITGRNLELVPGERIVQELVFAEDDWPEGHVSKATFLLREAPGGTKLMFTHEDVPEKCADDIAQGWIAYYWEPLRKMMER